MRRSLALSLLAVALATVPLRADDTTRTFESNNFKITLPSSDWAFVEVSDQEKGDGYVARMVRRTDDPAVYVDAWAYVSPTKGLSLEERLLELKQAAVQEFDQVNEDRVLPSRLSGLNGGVALVRGKLKAGAMGLYASFGIIADGTFHHLIVHAFNGAEKKLGPEIEALRRGYRLLKGAGPEEPAGGPGLPHGGDEGTQDAKSDWPKDGPVREGAGVSLPHWNLRWNVPEGTSFHYAVATKDEKEPGLMVRLESRKTPAKKEGSPKEPVEGTCRIDLSVRKDQGGATANEILNNPNVQMQLEKDVFSEYRLDATRTQLLKDTPIGNWRGAAIQMVGVKEGSVRFFRLYVALLKGSLYQWGVVMEGDADVDDLFKEEIKQMIGGVEFLDTAEPVRGPFAVPGVPHDVATRGKPGDGKEIRYGGFGAKRPKELNAIDITPGTTENGFQLGWETRSDDGKAYLYFDVVSIKEQELKQAKLGLEDLVKNRESNWRQDFPGGTTVTKGKNAWFPDTFARLKGLGYRFTGSKNDVPYVETGWFVEGKSLIYGFRLQYGGTDAEKTLEKIAKAIEKAIKIDK
jgi:hypothetical protein